MRWCIGGRGRKREYGRMLTSSSRTMMHPGCGSMEVEEEEEEQNLVVVVVDSIDDPHEAWGCVIH